MQHVKCVLVGSAESGKTALATSYAFNSFPPPGDYVPTIFDNYSVIARVDDRSVNLGLWDTAGLAEHDAIRPQALRGSDVVLLCYALNSPESLVEAKGKWYAEIRKHCPRAPIILVGTKCDLRAKEELISHDEGDRTAREIGAVQSTQCSALTQEGLRDVFDTAVRAVFLRLRKTQKQRKANLEPLWEQLRDYGGHGHVEEDDGKEEEISPQLISTLAQYCLWTKPKEAPITPEEEQIMLVKIREQGFLTELLSRLQQRGYVQDEEAVYEIQKKAKSARISASHRINVDDDQPDPSKVKQNEWWPPSTAKDVDFEEEAGNEQAAPVRPMALFWAPDGGWGTQEGLRLPRRDVDITAAQFRDASILKDCATLTQQEKDMMADDPRVPRAPLEDACMRGNTEAVRLLLVAMRRALQLDRESDFWRLGAPHWLLLRHPKLSEKAWEKVVLPLFAEVEAPRIEEIFERSILMCCGTGRLSIMKRFITSPGIQIRQRLIARMIATASYHGHAEVVMACLNAVSLADSFNEESVSPLMYASQNGHLSVVNVLIAAKANLNATDKQKRTALMAACVNKESRVVGALVEAGAKIDAKDSEGVSAQTICKKRGFKRIGSLLKH